MLFLEPQRTPYDLHFRFFGTPVRVHPMFWALGAIMGWGWFRVGGLPYVAMWVGCVFASILIHEMGHIWMGRLFGSHGHVVMYSFGGLAIGSSNTSVWWRRVLVAFAGPLAGFVFLAAVLGVTFLYAPNLAVSEIEYAAADVGIRLNLGSFGEPRFVPLWARVLVSNLVWINLFWGLINLLPVFPLDGGQISREFFVRHSPRNGLRLSLGISFLVAGILAVHALMFEKMHRGLIPFLNFGGWWMGLLFALLAIQSFQAMQQASYHDPMDPWQGQGRPWERRW